MALIAFGALWPMLLTTVYGVSSAHPHKHEVAAALGLSRPAYVWKIALPAAAPGILGGPRLGLTAALILAAVGAMTSVQGGWGKDHDRRPPFQRQRHLCRCRLAGRHRAC